MANNISSNGDLYGTEIRIQYSPPVNMCKGVLEINCMIGHLNFTPINQTITVCKGMPIKNRRKKDYILTQKTTLIRDIRVLDS